MYAIRNDKELADHEAIQWYSHSDNLMLGEIAAVILNREYKVPA